MKYKENTKNNKEILLVTLTIIFWESVCLKSDLLIVIHNYTPINI